LLVAPTILGYIPDMLQITPTIAIDDRDLVVEFVRSSGPGGQNVNKVATAAQLRFDLRGSASLPADVKDRLARLAGHRMTQEGVLVIEAKRFRTQEQNRMDAEARLAALVKKALLRPKRRLPTRPSAASRQARLQSKQRRGAIKKTRQSRPDHDS
jgi:ribosome-associated protein